MATPVGIIGAQAQAGKVTYQQPIIGGQGGVHHPAPAGQRIIGGQGGVQVVGAAPAQAATVIGGLGGVQYYGGNAPVQYVAGHVESHQGHIPTTYDPNHEHITEAGTRTYQQHEAIIQENIQYIQPEYQDTVTMKTHIEQKPVQVEEQYPEYYQQDYVVNEPRQETRYQDKVVQYTEMVPQVREYTVQEAYTHHYTEPVTYQQTHCVMKTRIRTHIEEVEHQQPVIQRTIRQVHPNMQAQKIGEQQVVDPQVTQTTLPTEVIRHQSPAHHQNVLPTTAVVQQPVQYAAAPVQYAAAPVQYGAAPVQYAQQFVQGGVPGYQYAAAPTTTYATGGHVHVGGIITPGKPFINPGAVTK